MQEFDIVKRHPVVNVKLLHPRTNDRLHQQNNLNNINMPNNDGLYKTQTSSLYPNNPKQSKNKSTLPAVNDQQLYIVKNHNVNDRENNPELFRVRDTEANVNIARSRFAQEVTRENVQPRGYYQLDFELANNQFENPTALMYCPDSHDTCYYTLLYDGGRRRSFKPFQKRPTARRRRSSKSSQSRKARTTRRKY
jgi:hypothetical protein